ncbi:MAG: hypothetical protein HXY18_00560 [Bryobacteraceae bacterium]|jgi:hypothetical protein|nr:hypothetical protein [Bryobacteraceae bacterium]
MLKRILFAILLALPLISVQPPKPVAQDPWPSCYPCPPEPTKPGGGGNLV